MIAIFGPKQDISVNEAGNEYLQRQQCFPPCVKFDLEKSKYTSIYIRKQENANCNLKSYHYRILQMNVKGPSTICYECLNHRWWLSQQIAHVQPQDQFTRHKWQAHCLQGSQISNKKSRSLTHMSIHSYEVFTLSYCQSSRHVGHTQP